MDEKKKTSNVSCEILYSRARGLQFWYVCLFFAMATAARQRKIHTDVTIEKKVEAIRRVEAGESARSFARTDYDVDHSTVSRWVKNKEKIFAEYERNCASDRCRGIRETENVDANTLTYEFFRLCRSKGIIVQGPMLQT